MVDGRERPDRRGSVPYANSRSLARVQRPVVLISGPDEERRAEAAEALGGAGLDVRHASSGAETMEALTTSPPAALVLDVAAFGIEGFGLLRRLRATPHFNSLPVVALTAAPHPDQAVRALRLGADDAIGDPLNAPELVARVWTRIERPPGQENGPGGDARSGALDERAFQRAFSRELARIAGTSARGCLAYIDVAERQQLHTRLGHRDEAQIQAEVARITALSTRPYDIVGEVRGGHIAIFLPDVDEEEAGRALRRLSRVIAGHTYTAEHGHFRLTPVIGYVGFAGDRTSSDLHARAMAAMGSAAMHLDLLPLAYHESMGRDSQGLRSRTPGKPLRARIGLLTTPFQVLITIVVGMVIPFLFYAFMDLFVFDITHEMYLVVVAALLFTGVLIWVEGLLTFRRNRPPAFPRKPYPKASAIIAAYLPNEAATIVETVEAFLALRYDAGLQVILAYNTPIDLPVERTLEEIARGDPRLLLYRVEGSTSKAQNVNAALAHVTGEFTGLFDADHLPSNDTFPRAWRWLSDGYDVVQGHPVIRNGDASWVTKMITVEFETIYAVSHPGRTKMHGFGLFCGSNGFWRTDLLRSTRMQGSMLTEDIDSAMRVIEEGYRIATDPRLVSRELAPTTLQALWNQRMRWAQGWLQVSRKHFWPSVRSEHLTFRQKLGAFHLLAWREFYPWISWQMFPIITYWSIREGGPQNLDWLIPIFVFTTVFTMTVGPAQTIVGYIQRDPLAGRGRWYVAYLVLGSIFYGEFKNVIVRVAHVKELLGDRRWKITPRQSKPLPGADEADGESTPKAA